MSLLACIKLTKRTGYFFNVSPLLFSLFSKPVMIWSYWTITPWQPTVWQTCSKKFLAVTTLILFHNATKPHSSCLLRSGEEMELSQGWLEWLLTSHRWIRWEIASSGHIKYWEGIPGFLQEPKPTIRGQTMCPTWPSKTLCAMLGQRVRDPLSLIHPSPSEDCLWKSCFVPTISARAEEAGALGKSFKFHRLLAL